MRLGPCPAGDALSAYLDGELEPLAMAAVSAHISGCQRCSAELAGLRSVDGLLSAPLMAELPRVHIGALFGRRTRPLRTVVIIVLCLAALAAVAAGGTVAGVKLAKFFTSHHVETQPVEQFPDESWKDLEAGQPAEITPVSPGQEVRPVDEVEESLRSHLLEPSYLPEGYELSERGSPFKMEAKLLYLKPGAASITIRETNHSTGPIEMPPVPPNAAETVDIHGNRGIYIRGGWHQDDPSSIPVWQDDLVHSVMFDESVLVVEISAPLTVDKDKLIQIALSMQ
jgi:hypothetical protein